LQALCCFIGQAANAVALNINEAVATTAAVENIFFIYLSPFILFVE
jgi:hypothetical protein